MMGQDKNKSKKTGCDCLKCQSLCRHEPGWFLPEEIDPVAQFLGLTLDEFSQKYCNVHSLCLSPKYLTREKRCLFFLVGHCRIHDVKPYECRKVYGCESPRRHKRIREMIRRQWEKC